MKNDYRIVEDQAEIFLKGHGKFHITKIDLADFDKVNSIPGTWYARYTRSNRSYYASSCSKVNGKNKHVEMHRLIHDFPDGFVIDHLNHDTLDNRRSNLRVVTNQINTQNRKIINPTNKSSGIKNVTWYNPYNKWAVRVGLDGKRIHIGYFEGLEEAKLAAVEARKKYFGIGA